MKNKWYSNNPWAAKDSIWFNYEEDNTLNVKDNSVINTNSKFKVLLLGGIDYYNDGTYGVNKKLAEYVEKISFSDKYNIPLKKGDIQIVNSPAFSNEKGGKDIFKDILKIIKNGFDYKNGTLILYGYSWGGQLLLEFLKYFKQNGIRISLLVTIDAARGLFSFAVNNDITTNVNYNLNIYQTKPSIIGSYGGENEGNNVKNVNLTGEVNSKNESIVHSNIDDYTLLYSAQIIVYALKGLYSFYNYSESEIKIQIKNYASQGF